MAGGMKVLLLLVTWMVVNGVFCELREGQPNVCRYERAEQVSVRVPSVRAFTASVRVYRPGCYTDKPACIKYEKRTLYRTVYRDQQEERTHALAACCPGWSRSGGNDSDVGETEQRRPEHQEEHGGGGGTDGCQYRSPDLPEDGGRDIIHEGKVFRLVHPAQGRENVSGALRRLAGAANSSSMAGTQRDATTGTRALKEPRGAHPGKETELAGGLVSPVFLDHFPTTRDATKASTVATQTTRRLTHQQGPERHSRQHSRRHYHDGARRSSDRRHHRHHQHHRRHNDRSLTSRDEGVHVETVYENGSNSNRYRYSSSGDNGTEYDAYSYTIILVNATGKSNEQKAAAGRDQQPGEAVTQVPRPEEAEEDAFRGSSYAACGRVFCYNGGRCVYNRCICPRGFYGSRCQYDRDECQVNNGGCEHSCKNTVGYFMCCCSPGYRLRHDGKSCQDVNECELHNGGCSHECANTVGSYRCLCGPGSRLLPDGRTCVGGASCAERNGGCDHYCDDARGWVQCSCRSGYRLERDGKWCEPLDPCLVDNGGCQQTCLAEQGHVHCSCRKGFTLGNDLVSCVDLDECAIPDTCSHQCRNTWGSYECVCNTGYQLGTDNKSCFMIDMEVINSCLENNGGCQHMCRHGPGGAVCTCHPGYELKTDGRTCQDENECGARTHRCQQECINTAGGYACACTQGFTLSSDTFTCLGE
ncbi:multiple epidermal growth factor-like domains protein 6 [Eriocheir sinensis]|uniref:multiple epidermal growth factor-like domains protein 6 n=1 Tax=Eriocheir sinensis TaxID=95602 RepID=UPI0021C87E26|nr:multiple epidermal growth factor-like domains protein 6 [Eriocheir sinensis]